MEVKAREYFEKELENILDIHFEAKYYLEDVKYLCNPLTIEENIASIDNFIIKRIRIAFWRLCIIEIAKLFQKSNNQHYNLINFIDSLISGYDDYFWIQGIKKDKLEEWLIILNSPKILSIRIRINVQRNKYFAHTDKNPHESLESVQLSFDEVYDLLNLTESIIFELEANCLNISTDFEISGMENAGNILNAFAALKEQRESKMKQERDKFNKKT